MALLQALIPSVASGEWQFDLDARKRAQDIGSMPSIHWMAAKRLNRHLVEKAAAELEGNLDISDHVALPAELVPSSGHNTQPQPKTTHTDAQFAQTTLGLAYWDLTAYSWSLEYLARELTPARIESRRQVTTWAFMKLISLCIFRSPESDPAARVVAWIFIYQVVFALAYWSSLHLMARCHRRVKELKEKIKNENVCVDDIQSWNGVDFRVTNWLARKRDLRKGLFESWVPWVWVVDMFVYYTYP